VTAIKLAKDGDHRAEFDQLFHEFEQSGGLHRGSLEPPHLTDPTGPTVVILDGVARAFAEFLQKSGWREF
jgi:hypothetical protein